MYILNSIDRVFNVSITSTPVNPNDKAQVDIMFRPTIADQSYTDYYVVDDTAGNNYRVSVTGKCFGEKNHFYLLNRCIIVPLYSPNNGINALHEKYIVPIT